MSNQDSSSIEQVANSIIFENVSSDLSSLNYVISVEDSEIDNLDVSISDFSYVSIDSDGVSTEANIYFNDNAGIDEEDSSSEETFGDIFADDLADDPVYTITNDITTLLAPENGPNDTAEAVVIAISPTVDLPPTMHLYIGDSEANLFIGTAYGEFISGGLGNDVLRGGQGDDLIFGGSLIRESSASDNDEIHGGAGNDTINGNQGDDLLEGNLGRDTVIGGTGHDTLLGGRGYDRLIGNGGNDILAGGNGGDRLFGGNGDDMLYGDSGDDTLTGGAGADTFFFGLGDDVITDFEAGIDVISTAPGSLTFEALWWENIEQVGDDLVITRGSNSLTLLNTDFEEVYDYHFFTSEIQGDFAQHTDW